MSLIENKINDLIKRSFEKEGYDIDLLGVKKSTHADLQCNDCLSLAKKEGKNPREIAEKIAVNLSENKEIDKAEIAGPGFINITLNNDFLLDVVGQISNDEKFGFAKEDEKKKVFLDYGGANVAKVLHVGHLRSAIIGESVKRIEQFCENETIADIHLGDWGTPIGKCICELKLEQPDLPYFDENKKDDYPEKSPVDVEKLGTLYIKANLRCKEDEEAAENARIATKELQAGRPGYIALWKHFIEVSINDMKHLMDILDVSFDLWNGESEAQEILDNELMKKLEPYIKEDQGAKIISLKEFETNKTLPPVLIVKSDGSYIYHATDLGCLYKRKEEYNPDEIIYFTDNRQSLHFEQVFLAAKKTKIVDENYPMYFCGFGTVNGKDGKPFKTRDGGVATLRFLIDSAFNKAKEILPKPDKNYSEEEINKLAKQISVGALKFNDMKNPRSSDYVFDIDAAMSFEGKTGPYMQYAIARINSILEKSGTENFENKIEIKTKEEKSLALKIDEFSLAVKKAYKNKDPYFIADYSYDLAKIFSSFYTACPILNNENEDEKLSRLSLSKCVKDILTISLDLLGIEAPYKMLKRQEG